MDTVHQNKINAALKQEKGILMQGYTLTRTTLVRVKRKL